LNGFYQNVFPAYRQKNLTVLDPPNWHVGVGHRSARRKSNSYPSGCTTMNLQQSFGAISGLKMLFLQGTIMASVIFDNRNLFKRVLLVHCNVKSSLLPW